MRAKKDVGRLSYSLTWDAWTVVYKVFGVQLLGEKLSERMKARVTWPGCIAHAQHGVKAGTSLIGWLTQRGRGLSRKWSDIIIGPIGGGYPMEKAMGGHKRRSWVNQSCITCKKLSWWRTWHQPSSMRYTGSTSARPMMWLSNPHGDGWPPSI